MKRLFVVFALLALAGAAGAQPTGRVLQPGVTTLCLDVDGSTLTVVCHGSGSRIDLTEDICTCPEGGAMTDAPVCGRGEREPAATVALNRARHDAARDGSLIGDTFEGAPMCVAPRNPH